MRVLLLSDIHADRNHESVFDIIHRSMMDTNFDIALVAGDIDYAEDVVKTLIKIFPKDKKIVFIAGNHEYYRRDDMTIKTMMECNDIIKKSIKDNNCCDRIFYLNDSFVIIDGLYIIGSTLWTDFKYGKYNQATNMMNCQETQNDYKYIYNEDGIITPKNTLQLHLKSKEYIRKETQKALNLGYRPIIMTHHLATPLLEHPYYKDSNSSPSFVSENDTLIKDALLYLCGHSHYHNIALSPISGIPMVCNPFGYFKDKNNTEYTGFNDKLIMDIPHSACYK